MASDLQPAVTALVERRLVEDRTRGTPSAELEGSAVLETAALALWSNPRMVDFLWHLARNGLLSALDAELAAVVVLREAVGWANRPAYAIRDLKPLEQARLALLQIEGQGNLNTSGGPFQTFTKAIDLFLNTALAPSVRVRGESDLVMSGSEAVATIPDLYASLVSLHSETVDRISKLAVCLQNFQQTDVGTYSGATTAVRARLSLEQVIEALSASPTATNPREMALDLLAMKASMKAMGARPDRAIKISSAARLPAGRQLRLRSEEVLAEASLPLPLTFTGASASVEVNGETSSMLSFPLDGYSLNDSPCVVSAPVVYPITVPAGGALFVALDDTVVRVPVAPGPTTLAGLVGQINALPGLHAEELHPDSGRIAIVATTASSIGIEATYMDGLGALDASTLYASVGFGSLPRALAGSTDPELVRDVLLWMTSGGVEVVIEEQALKIRDLGFAPTSTITYSIGSYAGTVSGVTDTVWLEEGGEAVSPVGLVDVGDYFTFDGIQRTVTAVGDFLTITPALSGLDAPAEVRSGLVQEIDILVKSLLAATAKFSAGGWLSGLAAVDAEVTRVLGQPTVGSINACLTVLGSLSADLTAVKDSIVGSISSSATSERADVGHLLSTLRERGFDRAHDFLLRGAVQEIFSMDWQTASYAGNVLASAAAVATNDIRWPNRAKDEGTEAASVDEG